MGHEFSDEGGNPISFVPGQPDPFIDQEGQVFQGDQLIAKLGVFAFEDPTTQLRKVGGGFAVKDPNFEPEVASPENFKVLQGFIENSNVSAIEEMVGLIEVSRAHEANQKMIQSFDENIGKAIGALGQTS
jgi:flagellar basal-body rod protein FlgF